MVSSTSRLVVKDFSSTGKNRGLSLLSRPFLFLGVHGEPSFILCLYDDGVKDSDEKKCGCTQYDSVPIHSKLNLVRADARRLQIYAE